MCSSVLTGALSLLAAGVVFAETHPVSTVEQLTALVTGGTLADDDVISLAEGRYAISQPLDFSARVTLEGATGSRDDVIIDGQGVTRGIIFRKSSSAIRYLTVSNCYSTATGGCQTEDPGAGLGTPTGVSGVSIADCAFACCTNAGGLAGAYRCYDSHTVYRTRFSKCSAKNGGVSFLGRDSAVSSYAFVDCEFLDNSSTEEGGSLYTHKNAQLRLNCCRAERNTATRGGVYFGVAGGGGGKDGSPLWATNCVFVANRATGDGGALCPASGVVSLDHCAFTNNVAGTNGGAFVPYQINRSIVVNACDFYGNEAKQGGAIYASLNGTEITIDLLKDSTFTANKSTAYSSETVTGGGAVCAILENCVGCTFKDNIAATAGGAWAVPASTATEMSISNCLFCGNMATNTATYSGGGAVALGIKAGANIVGPTGVRFADCAFVENAVTNATGATSTHWGGAVFSADGSEFVRCGFTNNLCQGMGTVFSGGNCGRGVFACSFYGNTNSTAGALAIEHVDTNVWNFVEDCRFVKNHSADNGGALALEQSYLSLSNCVFEGNTCTTGGGAIRLGGTYNSVASGSYGWRNKKGATYAMRLLIDSCVFRDNASDANGCAVNFTHDCSGAFSPQGSVRNCLFDGNHALSGTPGTTAYTHGGGIYANAQTALAIESSTFAFNEPLRGYNNLNAQARGGAIYLDGTASAVSNCAFYCNRVYMTQKTSSSSPFPGRGVYPWKYASIYAPSSVLSTQVVHCVVFQDPDYPAVDYALDAFTSLGTYYHFKSGENGNLVTAADPCFADLANGDYSLLAGSPLIDRGVNVPWMQSALDLSGERRHARIQGGVVDVGCYEYKPVTGLLLLFR